MHRSFHKIIFQPCISKTAGRRETRTKIWGGAGVFAVYTILLTVQCFKVSPRSFGAFPIFDNLVSGKWLDVERNGLNVGPWGLRTQCIQATFDS